MSLSPLVSVVIPTYNGDRFLAAALDSVFAQHYSPAEVIVVDDESSDRTREIAARYPVRLLSQRHAGGGVARNTGIAAASGQLVALLDQDDVWLKGKLARQVEFLGQHAEIDGVLCPGEPFLEPGTQRPYWFASAGSAGYPSGWLLRREVFDQVGEFDPSSAAPDLDWLLRARDLGFTFHVLAGKLFRYRVHDANSMHLRDEVIGASFVALKRSLDRIRVRDASPP